MPYMNGYYEECFGPISKEDATSIFGQFDHVRRIGKEDIQNTFGRIIPIERN